VKRYVRCQRNRRKRFDQWMICLFIIFTA
jgi:hypothetical protein